MNGWLEIREFAGMLSVLAALLFVGAGLKAIEVESAEPAASVQVQDEASEPAPAGEADTGSVLRAPAVKECSETQLRG